MRLLAEHMHIITFMYDIIIMYDIIFMYNIKFIYVIIMYDINMYDVIMYDIIMCDIIFVSYLIKSNATIWQIAATVIMHILLDHTFSFSPSSPLRY